MHFVTRACHYAPVPRKQPEPESPAPVQRLTAQEEYAAFLEGKDLTKPVAGPAAPAPAATQTPLVGFPRVGRPDFTHHHTCHSSIRRSIRHSRLLLKNSWLAA